MHSLVESRPPWPARVKVLAGMMGAVMALAGTLVGMIVKSTNYFTARDAAMAALSRDVATIGRSLDELHAEVGSNHEETRREIAGVQQSRRDAIKARDGQMTHVNDKIEQIETDVGRIEGQLDFFKEPEDAMSRALLLVLLLAGCAATKPANLSPLADLTAAATKAKRDMAASCHHGRCGKRQVDELLRANQALSDFLHSKQD